MRQRAPTHARKLLHDFSFVTHYCFSCEFSDQDEWNGASGGALLHINESEIAQVWANALMLAIIEKIFPTNWFRIIKFNETDLTGHLLCKSNIISHAEEKIGGKSEACSLCQIDTNNKHKSNTKCHTCQVPLYVPQYY